ncbi:hypothetical protein DVH24_036945 [Malus domestica]|uniref:Uncharacterized protein n=1 Tax=Malus domestica TaxID=3750 RepID=A0A498IKE3_MALDO|nr:hypothetical protein DVH24_036945 [Malus domestica]
MSHNVPLNVSITLKNFSSIRAFTLVHVLQLRCRVKNNKAGLRRSTILSTLGLGHALTWVIHLGNALAQTRLTSEFQWNPKPVSPKKASCYRR